MTGADVQQQTREDIAVIKTQLTNLCDNFSEFKDDNKKFCEKTTSKVNANENGRIAIEQKVSNQTIFQSTLSVVIGAIATYLGVKR